MKTTQVTKLQVEEGKSIDLVWRQEDEVYPQQFWYVAHSPDCPGLYVTAPDFVQLKERAFKGYHTLKRLNK